MPFTLGNMQSQPEIPITMMNGTRKKAGQQKENQCDTIIWNKKVPHTLREEFQKIIEKKYNLKINSYWDLHKWTVDNFEEFWEEVWSYFGIVFSKPYEKVFLKTGPGFLDNKWFSGAELNYAENILRIRDSREALVCLDEGGNLETVTFAELFEEVKLYAAAFRKRGLKTGDTVACYMSHRKEAVYAMLAATSIGAIWGGPHPYSGAKLAANVIQNLEAKFLIVVDRVYEDHTQVVYDIIDNLTVITKSAPSLECIIIVPFRKETLLRDLSHLPTSCLLDDFLASGRTPDGGVPDIVFEQLPFDHPISVCFSSGTTGQPKGVVHSAGSLLGLLVDFALHFNLKSGDTIYSFYAMGWSLWNYFVSSLYLGVRLFLDNDTIYNTKGGKNMWDLISDHDVSFAFLVTGIVDRMEKRDTRPTHTADFKSLKFITIGGSPVKLQNYNYVKSIVKENVFVGNLYGVTEIMGSISACDLNTPCYANQIQVPVLGKDVKVFDQDGRPVVGERGEVVLSTPCPDFPVYLWKDENNEQLNKTYFSKYSHVWQQNDEAYINPRTNGIVILGRSDDTIIQYGDRFESSDIYFAIHDMEEIQDYICVGQNKGDGDSRAVLFVQLKEGHTFTPELRAAVAKNISDELFYDCVPELILEVKSIPYNFNNKRVESLIRKIVANNQIPQDVNIKNPGCLEQYLDIPEIVNYNDNNQQD